MPTLSKQQSKCQKCGRTMSVDKFYLYRDGTHAEMCKQCMTMHVDNFDPATFLWLFKKFDIPYIQTEWNVLRDRAYAKNPLKMSGMSVFGKYLSKMKLNQWSKYRYADSDRLNEQSRNKAAAVTPDDAYMAELQQQLQAGAISEAEYATRMPTQQLHEQHYILTGNNPYNTAPGDARGSDNPFRQQNFISQDLLPDPASELTDDDKIYLAMKWGRTYTPQQWVSLQQKYNEMMQSFDIQDSDTVGTLIVICKTYLKMNQAIDMGDMTSFKALSSVYDTLRKSAKFTAAQKKETQARAVDSVGQLVAYCQKAKGAIPRCKLTYDYDIIDKVIKDMKNYNKTLIYQDTALARQIEQYLHRREQAQQMRKDKEEAAAAGLDAPEISDADHILHQQMIEAQRLEDEVKQNES